MINQDEGEAGRVHIHWDFGIPEIPIFGIRKNRMYMFGRESADPFTGPGERAVFGVGAKKKTTLSEWS
jgi:hypothetical protein